MRYARWFQHEINVSGRQRSRIRRLALAFVIVEALVQSAGSVWTIRDILIVFTGKATLNVSTLFPKYGAHGFDAGSDHAWVDDTGLHMWILCFRIGGLGIMVRMVLFSRGSTTRLVCVGYVLQSENWRRVFEECHREGSRHAQGELPACLDRHAWSCLRDKDLKFDKLSQFVLDECDKCLDKIDMRKDVRQIFVETPKKKQVMMFSATMTLQTRGLCKKFISDPQKIRVDEESKHTLHGLLQCYSKLTEKEELKAQRSYGCSRNRPSCCLCEDCSESDRSRQVARHRVPIPRTDEADSEIQY